MKKILSMMLLLAMVLAMSVSFSACDPVQPEGEVTTPAPEETTESATEVVTEAPKDESGLAFALLGDGTYSVSQGTALQNTTDIVIPATYNGAAVTKIADNAFVDCKTLTSIVIPDGVTTIGENAFDGCRALSSVVIPDSVTTIGKNAFLFCSVLEEITLPKSLTAIGNSFSFCEKLTELIIPAGVTAIDEWAFSYCSELTQFVVDEGNTAYCSVDGVLFNKDKTKLIQYPKGKAGDYTVPDGVTTIGTVAFYTSEKLTSVTLPASMVTIENLAFSNCTELTQLVVDEENPALCSVDGVIFNRSKTELLVFPFAKAESYAIPEGVTSIASFAFSSSTKLTSITFPSSLTSIDNFAFSGCEKLMVQENGINYICNWAIEADRSVTETVLRDSTVGIANHAFDYLSSLTSVVIPEGVVTMGDWTFSNCKSLTSVSIPASVQSISRYTFYACPNLTDIHYAGTKAEWYALEKESGWDSDMATYTVHCTDGDIAKS